jgi:replication factor C large subunit
MNTWTDTYRPRHLKDVIGNTKAKEALYAWAEAWQRGAPKKRAVILHGKAGIGKTSSAHALANDFGWKVIELNASDERNRESIRKIALTGAVNEVLGIDGTYISSAAGARRLIILDEADNLYERGGDYGGKRAIVDTIKATKQPIVLIANDLYALLGGSGGELRGLCTTIEFKKVHEGDVGRLLSSIARRERLTGDPSVIRSIARMCDGDVRSAVNDLQSIAYENRLEKSLLSRVGYRDREQEVFSGLRAILKAEDMRRAIRQAYQLSESPDSLILWVDENLPVEYTRNDDLQRAYERLSRADVFLGRARRQRHYGCWRFATELMTGGVAVAKKKAYAGFTRYHFPSWLRRMSHSKHARHLRRSVARKLGGGMHCSAAKARAMFPLLRRLFEDTDTAARLAIAFDLDEQDLSVLVGDRAAEVHAEKVALHKREHQAVLYDFKNP